MIQWNISRLGAILRAQRTERRLSLRDLADQIGVSLNTLSRVERGHVPDLVNFQRIIDWLDMPAENFLEASESSTTNAIAKHLLADRRLSKDAADKIVELVDDMYHKLVSEQTQFSVHLRSAKLFTPAAGALLAQILGDIQSSLQDPLRQ